MNFKDIVQELEKQDRCNHKYKLITNIYELHTGEKKVISVRKCIKCGMHKEIKEERK